GWASVEVKVSLWDARLPEIGGVTDTLPCDMPWSRKSPLGVWIVAVYGPVWVADAVFTSVTVGLLTVRLQLPPPPDLLPMIVVVPEMIVNVALKLVLVQLPVSEYDPG